MSHSINNSTKTIYHAATEAFPCGLYKTPELDNTFLRTFYIVAEPDDISLCESYRHADVYQMGL